MTTAYQTGPGMYCATTKQVDPSIPPGVVRVHCVRLEGYDLPAKPEQHDLDTEFTIVFAMAEGNPSLAKAMLDLGKAIVGNKAMLEEIAKSGGF